MSEMSPIEPDKRRYTRLKKTLLVYFQKVDPENPASPLEVEEHVSSTLDISVGGMMLRATKSIPLGSFLEVKFQPSIIGRELTLIAKVLRYQETVYEGLFYIPIEFQSLSTDDRAELESFIRIEETQADDL
jgi:hypothetical protein